MLILGVEPSQRTYKDRMLTDTLYELKSSNNKVEGANTPSIL